MACIDFLPAKAKSCIKAKYDENNAQSVDFKVHVIRLGYRLGFVSINQPFPVDLSESFEYLEN